MEMGGMDLGRTEITDNTCDEVCPLGFQRSMVGFVRAIDCFYVEQVVSLW